MIVAKVDSSSSGLGLCMIVAAGEDVAKRSGSQTPSRSQIDSI